MATVLPNITVTLYEAHTNYTEICMKRTENSTWI